jgi:hypothetical protein
LERLPRRLQFSVSDRTDFNVRRGLNQEANGSLFIGLGDQSA